MALTVKRKKPPAHLRTRSVFERTLEELTAAAHGNCTEGDHAGTDVAENSALATGVSQATTRTATGATASVSTSNRDRSAGWRAANGVSATGTKAICWLWSCWVNSERPWVRATNAVVRLIYGAGLVEMTISVCLKGENAQHHRNDCDCSREKCARVRCAEQKYRPSESYVNCCNTFVTRKIRGEK